MNGLTTWNSQLLCATIWPDTNSAYCVATSRRCPRAGRLIDLLPDYEVTATDFDTAAWLIYPSRAYVPLKVRAFIDALKKGMAI